MNIYTALIIDVVKSRTYGRTDRSDIQVYIKDVITLLNQVFRNSFELEMVFSAGDEIQGLFTDTNAAYLYYRWFSMLVYPVKIRGGIGVGEWTIRVAGEPSTAQDGPAYHLARQAIAQTDPSLGYQLLILTSNSNEMYINSMISGEMALNSSQSYNQKELLLLTEILYPIDAHSNIDLSELSGVILLIKRKYKLPFYARISQNRKGSLMMTALANLTCYQPKAKNVLISEPSSYITSGRIRGLAKNLSLLTETSHQNIGQTLAAGNISQIRNLASTVLNMMHDSSEDNKK